MQRCAVVDELSGEVLNVVMADPDTDEPAEGELLVALEPADVISAGLYVYDEIAKTFTPTPAHQAEMDAALAAAYDAAEQEAFS